VGVFSFTPTHNLLTKHPIFKIKKPMILLYFVGQIQSQPFAEKEIQPVHLSIITIPIGRSIASYLFADT